MVNYLRYLFLHFYIMDIPDILWLLLFGTVGFVAVYRSYGKKWWIKWPAVVGFLCMIVVVLVATIGDRTGGNTTQVNLVPFHSYREVMNGGNPEIYRSNFMNAVLFYPAGLLATALLPEKRPGWCRCILVVLLLGALSVGIEYAQYFWRLGRVEIDDVIHNTAGALAGSLAALLIPPLLGWLWNILKRLLTRYLGRKDT